MKFAERRQILLQGVMFLAVLTAFCGGGVLTACLMKIQAGPVFLRVLAGTSLSAGILLLLLLLLTWLFGRFFCSFCCPLGCFQDLAGMIPIRKKRTVSDLPYLRLLSAGLCLGLAAAGWSLGLLFLDPYSNTGRMISGLSWAGAAVWVLMILLVLWKRRIFCTVLCPVGATLGLISAKGLFRLKFNGNCVRCGQCASVCPAGAVDLQTGTIDNERCLRCMACVSACRMDAIVFGLPEKSRSPVDRSRRKFIIRGSILFAGLAAGFVLGKSGIRKFIAFASRTKVLPPGAGDAETFFSRCTACQLCVKNCPSGIIVPGERGIGPVSLDLTKGSCRYDCNRCTQLCPAGALKPLSLKEKQRTKIAEAHFDPRNCIVFQEGTPCGKCASVCPAGAIRLRKSGAPYPADISRCIGCGACQNVCPAVPKAIRIHEIEKQIRKV